MSEPIVGPAVVQPPAETPAQRAARDLEQQRGDWNNHPDPDNDNLVYVARTSEGARYERTYERRRGDVYYVYNEDNQPVRRYAEDGRNQRIYADYDTGVSAVAGTAHPRYNQFKTREVPAYVAQPGDVVESTLPGA